MKSRKERRAEARRNNVPFAPQYHGAPITLKQYFEGWVPQSKRQQKLRAEVLSR